MIFKFIKIFKDSVVDFFELLYPGSCAACNAKLFKGEASVCTHCRANLPYTHFHESDSNPIAQMFWGRVLVENATAYCYFSKGGRIQKLLHKIKYHNGILLATEVGRWFGYELKETAFNKVDFIVPVPLHPSKLQNRGYNQSELIGKGIAESLGKPIRLNIVRRKRANITQTKKGRYERWANVEGIFELCNVEEASNKHILVVDDVITTGATLESCISAILQAPGSKVSVAVLALA